MALQHRQGRDTAPLALKPPTVVANLNGGTLLTYPIARNNHNLPMVWQSIDGFSYRIPAGEASVESEHAGAAEAAFASCWQLPVTEKIPPAKYVAGARKDFAVWKVRAVVIPMVDSIDPFTGGVLRHRGARAPTGLGGRERRLDERECPTRPENALKVGGRKEMTSLHPKRPIRAAKKLLALLGVACDRGAAGVGEAYFYPDVLQDLR